MNLIVMIYVNNLCIDRSEDRAKIAVGILANEQSLHALRRLVIARRENSLLKELSDPAPQGICGVLERANAVRSRKSIVTAEASPRVAYAYYPFSLSRGV